MATELRQAGPEPASRTLTFLFTDIEGSTRLWEQYQHAMKEALERHDAILRGAVEGSRGQVVKTIGDGFMAVFDSAVDGVCATLDAQRHLAQEPWGDTGPLKVRMGLHAGEAAEREGDYFGPTLNRTARIMSAGHGGQVLLSAAAAALVIDRLPDGATLDDLGEYPLKGLGRPERVFQLAHPSLERRFPPLVTPARKRVELPEHASVFVGRTAELDEIARRLADDSIRLLTLTGPGGIGKTRLSLIAASAAADRFEDGVFFVDLATARDGEAVLGTIAATIGLTETRAESVAAEIAGRIGTEHVLLVLDNFEQVTPAAPVVAQLIQDCPRLKVIVTSREALHLRGEHLYAVPPLPSSEAVALFAERARAVQPDFEVTDENLPAIEEICARLDGLPLALELATARINLFSPQAMLDRLDSSLQLLKSGARDLPERQQTLRAAIEWSYELLEPGEQRLFELLAAFSGATFEAVEAVAVTLDGKLDLDPLEGLASLVDKSLVRQAEQNGDRRFVMLATIREYATERLRATTEFDTAAREAHAAYFAGFARAQFEQAAGDRRGAGLAALTANGENLRRAWRHWLAARDVERLGDLVDGLWLAYESQSRYQAMVDLAGDFLDVLDSAPPSREHELQKLALRTSRARALLGLHGLTDEVEEEFRRALDLFEGERENPQLFPVLRGLSSMYGFRAEFDKAFPMSRELLNLANAQDSETMRVDAHLMMGTAHAFTGDVEGGLEHLEQAIDCFESQRHGAQRLQLGPNPGIASYTTAALLLWVRGYPERALARANRAVALAMELQHPYTMAYALYHTSFLHFLRQEPEAMRDRAVAAVDVSEEYDLPIWRALGTVLLGAARTDLGHLEEGPAQIAEGVAQYQGLRSPPVFWPLLLYVRARAAARAGRPAEGLEFIDQSIELTGGAGPLAPLFFATKGDLLDDGAEWYRRGVDYATELNLGMPRVRAAVGLYRAQPSEQHRELLRAAYETLTEGFETPDLVAARELLNA